MRSVGASCRERAAGAGRARRALDRRRHRRHRRRASRTARSAAARCAAARRRRASSRCSSRGRVVAQVDAVVFTGGSAFGLATADGVMRYLADRARVPDRRRTGADRADRGDLRPRRVGPRRPGAAEGYAAAIVRPSATTRSPVGRVGAGRGATVGKWRGASTRCPVASGSRTRASTTRPSPRSPSSTPSATSSATTARCSPARPRRPMPPAFPTPTRRSRRRRTRHSCVVVHRRPARQARLPSRRAERARRHRPCACTRRTPASTATSRSRSRPARSTCTSIACGRPPTDVVAAAIRMRRCAPRIASPAMFASPRLASAIRRNAAGATLAEVAALAHDCTLCKLAAGRTQVVFGVGRADADLMFVGEGPGEQEDLQGEPFVGRAGKLLTQLIEGIGLHARRRVHRQRREVPAARQPRSRARGDRGVRAVARPPARADPAARHRHARQLRDQAAARDEGRHHEAARAAVPVRARRRRRRADPDVAPVGGAARRRAAAGRGPRRLRAGEARAAAR